MSAVAKFTLASLRANKVRTLVTIAGVALAAALLTAVLTSYTSFTHFLYESEAAQAGTWTTLAQQADSEELQRQIEEARTAPDVSGIATLQDVGFGQLTEEQQKKFGRYLTIYSAGGDLESVCAIRPSMGRMPENSNEIMMRQSWHDSANVNVGDTLTLPVGQRRAVAVPEEVLLEEASLEEGEHPNGQYGDVYGDEAPSTFEDGSLNAFEDGAILDSRVSYLSTELYGGSFNEELIDTHERTFTVVGFYDTTSYALMNSSGASAITANDPETTGLMSVYLTMTDATSQSELIERTEELFPEADITPHTAMLRYLGIQGQGYVWDTFFGLATVLAVVIVAACVSLIYNAFAISVAERTSQFGLLSSIGASKRQLRRSVLLEALLVACIGIPLGLLVGIGGCAATFAFIGPMIVSVLGDVGVPFSVHPAGWALIFSCVLTLVTVLVSAYLPAKRASRMNIVDALRWTAGGRVSKKGKRLAARNTNADKLWHRGTGLGRALGAGGMLARINRKRGATKGRTAAVSLTLAIALLMTAGSLSTFLGYLTDAADYGIDYDIELAASPNGIEQSTLGNIGSGEMYSVLSSMYDAAAEVPEAESVGWVIASHMPAVMRESMAGPSLRDGSLGNAGYLEDDQFGAMAIVLFLDDATFEDYANDLRLDFADFTDPTHPRAIAVGSMYGNDGERYQKYHLLQDAGTMTLYTGGTFRGKAIHDFTLENARSESASTSSTSESHIRFIPTTFDGEKTVQSRGMDDPEVSVESVVVDIAGLADHAPAVVQENGMLKLVMPQSLLPRFVDVTVLGSSHGAYDVVKGTDAQAEDAIQQAAEERIAELGFGYQLYPFTNDYSSMQDSNKMIATIVRVFCLLFTAILALIAMANVFNTVTNSLILRRREFAVMRSIGLSNKQFRRMIASECGGFAVASLIVGMVISIGITYVIYRIVTRSMEGISFLLPWTYVGLSIVMTVAVMLISVAYGMHRCKADNVVEALRAENI